MSDQPHSSDRRLPSHAAVIDAQSELCRLALADVSLHELLTRTCEILSRVLVCPRAGVFEQFGDSVLLRAGFGWDSVPTFLPHLLPQPEAEAEVVHLGGDPVLVAGFVDPDDRPSAIAVGPVPDSESFPAATGLVKLAADLLAGGWARRQLESELRASELRLVEAQELAHMGSYDWNILTDENIWSDELYRIYGYEPQEFNASYEHFLSLVHPDDRDNVIAVHQEAYRTLEPYSMNERIIRPDGTVRTLATTGEVIADDHGRPIRMRGVCLDATDRLRVVDELAKIERADAGRRQALEINDNVVQGLTTALWSLGQGLTEEAQDVVRRTLESAQAMMSELLHVGGAVKPGDLTRETALDQLLPDPVAEPGDADGGRAPTPGSRTGWTSVVVADDSEDIRLLLRMQFRDLPDVMIVGEATSGPEAVECAAEHRPDIMLLDMAMPDGDGLTAIPEILAVSPDTKVIALSGFRASELAEPAMAAGASAYAEKGNFDRLLDVLRSVAPTIGRSSRASSSVLEPADDGVGSLGHLMKELRAPKDPCQGLADESTAQIDESTSI